MRGFFGVAKRNHIIRPEGGATLGCIEMPCPEVITFSVHLLSPELEAFAIVGGQSLGSVEYQDMLGSCRCPPILHPMVV